jgi:hypothetical protein
MRIVVGVSLGLGAAFMAACAGHNAPQSGNAAPNAHWTAKVCTAVKDRITLSAGPSKDDTEPFATWQAGDGQVVYGLPVRVQQLTQVYVKALTRPEGKNAQLCVRYDGHAKKAYNFSGTDEDHMIKSSDSDDGSCHC